MGVGIAAHGEQLAGEELVVHDLIASGLPGLGRKRLQELVQGGIELADGHRLRRSLGRQQLLHREVRRVLRLLDRHRLLHRRRRERQEVHGQRLAVRPDVSRKRPRILGGLQPGRAAERVQDVAPQAHVDHLLERHGPDAFGRGRIGARQDGIEGVEVRRQGAELDADRRLQHPACVIERVQRRELQADHRSPLRLERPTEAALGTGRAQPRPGTLMPAPAVQPGRNPTELTL